MRSAALATPRPSLACGSLRASLALLAPLLLLGCTSRAESPVVPIAASASAIDARTVEVRFTHALRPGPVDPSGFRAFAPFARPVEALEIFDARSDASLLTVATSEHKGGEIYALALPPLDFEGVARPDAPSQVNFHGFGTTSVLLSLDTRGYVAPPAIRALVTLDPETGDYSEALEAFDLVESEPGVFVASLAARIDPERLHAARAVSAEDGAPVAELATFHVVGPEPVHVGLVPLLPRVPEFSAPADPTPGDGRAPVRIVLDDRLARELVEPRLRSSLSVDGGFDLSASRLDALARVPGEGRVYEVVLDVDIDPARRLDGTTPADFPYVVFLHEQGEDIPQRGATFVMPSETPQVIVVPIGNPALVPVTFRIDAETAFLDPAGTARGRYPGEGFFLTGELPSAEDALGRIAADAFTGGERATLEMKERSDAAGIFEKTIFLPPNRPYGWKVVRCPSGAGCAELNRHVLSSGRAFPTVMKNLVTENVDAAQSPTVALIDPAALDRVLVEGRTVDYTGAAVSNEGTEPQSPAIMFKQEAPDLVVTVGREPVVTPIYVVGTWRDVNIPLTPTEIISGGGTLELGPFDYDDGMQGRLPILRDLDLPLDPDGR